MRPTLKPVMRRLAIAILMMASSGVVAVTGAQAGVTVGLHTAVTVSPARGTPTTTFTIGFKTPLTTGLMPGLRSWEVASAVDRQQSNASCTRSIGARLDAAAVHHRLTASLSAAPKSWCAGTYSGTITLYRAVICRPGPIEGQMACPEIAFAPEPIAHFRFAVAPS
jgi:hypothetical protein